VADNIELNSGSGGATIRTDDDGSFHWQYVKLAFGADNTQTIVSASNPIPVDMYAGGSATALGGGVEAGALLVTIASDSTGVLSVDDNGGSLTVDNAALSVTGGGTEASALRVTLANDSTGVVSIDDNSGSLTVDNGGTFAVQVDAALPAGTNPIGKLAANSGVDIGDVDVLTLPSNTFVAEDGALGLGVLLQGDDGTDRKNINVDSTTGDVQVDVTNTVTVDATGQGDIPITLDGEAVTANLGATDNAVLDSIDAAVNEQPSSHYRNIDANAESEIKGSAGTLYWLHVVNLTAAVAYVHLYDQVAASVTPGTTTPNYTFPVPTAGDTNGAGFTIQLGARGTAFANGITMVVTTTTDGSTGDPGTNGVMVNGGYA
jgi:hypothetical protein